MHRIVGCSVAAALLLVAPCAATSLCDEPAAALQSLAKTRNQKHDIFVTNVLKRSCAHRSGRWNRTGWDVSIDGAVTWEETALVVTAAATDAYIRDNFLRLTGDLPDAISPADGECDLLAGCLFAHPNTALRSTPQLESGTLQHDTWDSQRVLNHYLRGAGLLWLRSRTSHVSGCHLAAIFARLYLQPTGRFKDLIDPFIADVNGGKYDKVVVVNVDSVHITVHTVKQALKNDGSTGVWLVGENARIEDIPKNALPSNVDVHMVKTDQVPAAVRSAVWAFVISHSTHYIGDLEPLYVKIGLVLGLGNYASFPKIIAGKSLWNDAYGFASCTAEEFNAHMKVASGVPREFITSKAKTFAELLKLPEQPPLPEVDWVSQKPPLIGRNSDKELCEGITLDSGDCPITVDELIQNGRSIQDPCNGSTDAPLCSVGEVNVSLAEPNSHAFAGEHNETVRDAEYAGTARTQRCGFQAQSGFNLLGAYDQFKQCKVVVATMVARGRDVLIHPANISPQSIRDPRVCFIAAMDVNAMLTHQLEPPEDGSLIQYGNWTVAAVFNSPWEGSTEMAWLRGARDANILRHLRFRVFPNAEYSMWIDGKHQLAVDPVKLLDDVLNKPQKHTAVFHHENQRCIYVEQRIVKGLPWAHQIPGYPEKIEALSERYHKEGMPSEEEGSPQNAYDLAFIINRHITPSNMLACLAYTEIESFTSRNQLHYPYTIWRAKAKPGIIVTVVRSSKRGWKKLHT